MSDAPLTPPLTQRTNIPVPDPSELTRIALIEARAHTDREVAHLKELLLCEHNALKELMLTMFSDSKAAVDKAELNFADRIKQADVNNGEVARGLTDKITSLEKRVNKTEASTGDV